MYFKNKFELDNIKSKSNSEKDIDTALLLYYINDERK